MSVVLGLMIALGAPIYDDADEAFAAGQERYADGEFEDAAAALQRAYELDDRPLFLYAWAQAERQSGDCAAAVKLYERFLESGATGDEAEAAQANLRTCARQLAESEEASTPAEPPPPPPPRVVERPAPTQTDEPSSRPVAWYRDPLGGALLGGGLVATAAGIGLRAGAEVVRKNASDETMHSGYDGEIRRARTLAGVGIGVLSVGGALIVGAVVRYVLVARKGKRG